MGIFELPEGYREIKRVNLQKDKKVAIGVNLAALVIAAVVFAVGNAFVPFSLRIGAENLSAYALGCLGVAVAMIAYLVAHELVHGIFIKRYSGKKAKYGFTGLYAYAGSDAYFGRRQNITIALAPVVVFGVLFLLLNIALPRQWFWPIYFLQIINLSGAAGDLYITALMKKLPADVLTTDVGVEMVMYSREG